MIKVLPSKISNLIAAGEVVGRPASVVKELMENGVDAGASNIRVIILDAGRTLIQIIDDGCGMNKEDAELCFMRHATSKITSAEDLEKIYTYGFRGEALASIAAVGEVTLRTRQKDEDTGIQIEISEPGITNKKVISCPKGCNIAVRSLFFNLPARRKFLKTDAAETRHIVAEFSRVALVNPSISFSLNHNGKTVFDLKPASNLKQRIFDIEGRDMIKKLVDINTETSVIKVSGFVGKPEDAKKTLGDQYLFINGRYFRSPFLHKAICKPYENLIPSGYTPSYFIFLETDPASIDVNIHPAKTEIKFEDEPMIFEIISASVREALGKNSFVPSIDFETTEVINFPALNSKKGEYQPPPKINYDPLFNPFDFDKEQSFEKRQSTPIITPSEGYGKLFEDAINKRCSLLQIQGKYIITPVKSGIMIINILRAKERIFFEKYLPFLAEKQTITQQSLFPQTIELSHQAYSSIMENAGLVAMLGFDIRDFGNNSIVVYGIPDGFPADETAVKNSIDNLTAAIEDGKPENETAACAAAAMARSAALSSKKELTPNEAQILVDELFACRESATTPDGRKCLYIITVEELDKRL